jgi:hypothetical protein
MYERRYHSEVTFVGGVVQGREAVAVIVVRVGSVPDQQFHYIDLASHSRNVERTKALGMAVYVSPPL